MDASWQGPPTDALGCAVPIQQFAVRTDQLSVAVQHAIAFPTGCLLIVRLAARRGSLDDASWESVLAGHFGADPDRTAAEGGPRLGVRFPDGSKATTVEHAFPGWAHATDRPQHPMLVESGGGASSTDQYYDSRLRLWLWPLPPPGPFEFVVDWPRLGLGQTSVVLDGAPLVSAARQALPLWA